MAFDYKKEYKEFYLPPRTPGLITVPAMNFLAVRGKGDPNEEGGAYKQALGMLYAVAFTIKMSKLGKHKLEGYFDYVVPPLEGLWWQEGRQGVDYARKDEFQWISLIRLPDFVDEAVFAWAREELGRKRPEADLSRAYLWRWEEGLCAQLLHRGPYDDEPESVARLAAFVREQGYREDFSPGRYHHEIYLGDPRRTAPDRLRTVIRHPVREACVSNS